MLILKVKIPQVNQSHWGHTTEVHITEVGISEVSISEVTVKRLSDSAKRARGLWVLARISLSGCHT